MIKGLTSEKAEQLLNKYGLNVIKEEKKKPILLKFLEQFNNFLTLLLIFAAILSFFIGEALDGALIIAIVVLNALFGLYQEKKAEEAIEALKQLTVTKIRVIRDGKEKDIDSRYLVPGDVIYIEEGSKIPADSFIVETLNLEINEAALTGESLPVVKKNKDEIFMGTVVAKGRGLAQVKKTGMQTKFGEIASNLLLITEEKTPLQKKLENLTRIIGILGISTSIVVFLLSFLQGSGYFPAFLLAVSLAVAVVPEGLPAVMTITLAIGVKEMSKRKAIVKKLSAIEALGSVSLIATDKTGTLTTNQMKVKEIYVDNKNFQVQSSKFKVQNNSQFSNVNKSFSLLILNGILCSSAALIYDNNINNYKVLGDPTEGALLYLAREANLAPEVIKKEWTLLNEKPFDSIARIMTVVVEKNPKSEIRNPKFVFSKGAPESILALTDKVLIGNKEEKLSEQDKGNIEKQVERWARKGLRVLAFAYKPVEDSSVEILSRLNSSHSFVKQKVSKNFTSSSSNMIFLGLVAIHDAPRPEVVEAVKKAYKAGIKIVMVTGDNEKTAEAVGVMTGIFKDGEKIMNGEDIDRYTDEELLTLLPKVRVFARTNPFQKNRIVKLYQKLGEIVAVTGDGVNDAIALKQADVGVAMGLVGTDVARETADVVITDDNFATIVNAVEEGRNIIKNLKNAVKYLLSCNISEAFSLVLGLLMGISNLFYPIQLLYINLLTDGLPALALAFSPRQENLMLKSPEKEQQLLGKKDLRYIFSVGSMATLVVLAPFFFFNGTQELKKTVAFSILTLIQSFIFIDVWLSHLSLQKHFNKLKSGIFLLAFILPFITQYLIVGYRPLSSLFNTMTISSLTYMAIIICSSLILVLIKFTASFI